MVGDGEVFVTGFRRRQPSPRCSGGPSLAVVWTCRSARMSSGESRSGTMPPASISPRFSRSSGGMSGRPRLCRSRPRRGRRGGLALEQAVLVQRPAAPDGDFRRRTLCSLEPVKYSRAAPNDSAGTTRRSAWISPPPRGSTRPEPWCRRPPAHGAPGSFVNADAGSAVGGHAEQVEVAHLLPAADGTGHLDLLHAGNRLICSRKARAMGRATCRGVRAGASRNASPSRICRRSSCRSPCEAAHPAIGDGLRVCSIAADLQFSVELRDLLGPQPADLQKLQDARRHSASNSSCKPILPL